MDYSVRTPGQLGLILRSRRRQRRQTQKAAGARSGLKQATVSAAEAAAGRTSVETLFKLLSALDLELVLREKGAPSGASEREW